MVDELVRTSGEIDVYVISGEESADLPTRPLFLQRSSKGPAYLKAMLMVVFLKGRILSEERHPVNRFLGKVYEAPARWVLGTRGYV